MSSFRFEASDSAGHIEKGLVEADSAVAARAALRARGLIPLAVDDVKPAPQASGRRLRRRFSDSELALVTRQLSSFLAAGLPVAQALGATIDQADEPAVREVFAAVRSDVFAGHRLAEALAQFPREFPEVYRATVSAGEDSGELAGVMERLAQYLEERQALRGKIATAFIYPAVVTLVAFVIVIFLMTYVVPQVVEVFRQSRQALPWPTRLLLGTSAVVRAAGIWIALALVAAGFGFRAWLRLPGRRLAWHGMLLRLPLFGRILRGIDTARFASTLAILAGAGVPLLRALEAARATLGNSVLAAAVGQIIEQVREGNTLSGSLARSKVFPPVLVHLAASGESTGQLSTQLERAASNLSREAERRALALSTLLEPLLILAMGGIVLAIVLAVLMPIIEINQLVR
jgi:general secretion pathway protein F